MWFQTLSFMITVALLVKAAEWQKNLAEFDQTETKKQAAVLRL